MKIYVHKHPEPGVPARCREVPDNVTLGEPWELMTLAQYKAFIAPYEAAASTQPQSPAPLPPASDAEIYAAKIAEGFLDPISGIRLKTDDTSRGWFTSMLVQVQLAKSVGITPGDGKYTIWDMSGKPHKLYIEELVPLMLRYGAYVEFLVTRYKP